MVQKISKTVEDRKRKLFWERHLEKWDESGLSQAEYCRSHDLKAHRFIYWRQKFQKIIKSPLKIVQLKTTNPIQIQTEPQFPSRDSREFQFSVTFQKGYSISVKEKFSSSEFKRLFSTIETLYK